ncbi:MAG: ABC transporter permease [Thiotrichales bacterium]|nr:ABC transporter permease [Thiotrichales bacterium]
MTGAATVTTTDRGSLRRRSFAARVLRSTFVRIGARVGAVWIGVLIVVAAFAPFLANTHPLLMRAGGRLQSPALVHLTNADVVLMCVFLAAAALLVVRCSLRISVVAMLATLAGSALLGAALTDPPVLTVYEQYREAVRNGEIEWAIHAPVPYSPKDYQRDAGDTGLEAPLSVPDDRTHWFGTDENGADVLSRMIHASRIALGIGLVATGIAMLIGIVVGGLMGWFSGVVDLAGMRLVEIFEAVPTLFLLLTFVAFFGRSLYLMMVIIGLTGWTGYARFVRAEFLRLRQQDYVQAAVACGLPLHSILFRHMLPNGIAPILVAASFGIASAILAEAMLSFLGLGLVDDPSWGQMLNQAVRSSTFNWWMAVFPGGAIFLTVFAYNLIGEALRDAIDPYLSQEKRRT